jgi:hypothetical protein
MVQRDSDGNTRTELHPAHDRGRDAEMADERNDERRRATRDREQMDRMTGR